MVSSGKRSKISVRLPQGSLACSRHLHAMSQCSFRTSFSEFSSIVHSSNMGPTSCRTLYLFSFYSLLTWIAVAEFSSIAHSSKGWPIMAHPLLNSLSRPCASLNDERTWPAISASNRLASFYRSCKKLLKYAFFHWQFAIVDNLCQIHMFLC